jgi:hypothetical protein
VVIDVLAEKPAVLLGENERLPFFPKEFPK